MALYPSVSRGPVSPVPRSAAGSTSRGATTPSDTPTAPPTRIVSSTVTGERATSEALLTRAIGRTQEMNRSA